MTGATMFWQSVISTGSAILASVLTAVLTGYLTYKFTTLGKYRDRLKEAVERFYVFDGHDYISHEKEIAIAIMNFLDYAEIYLNVCNINRKDFMQHIYDICSFFLDKEKANEGWNGFEVYLDSPARSLIKMICKNMPLIPRKSSGTVTIKTESGEVSISSVSDIEKLVLDEYKERRKKNSKWRN